MHARTHTHTHISEKENYELQGKKCVCVCVQMCGAEVKSKREMMGHGESVCVDLDSNNVHVLAECLWQDLWMEKLGS